RLCDPGGDASEHRADRVLPWLEVLALGDCYCVGVETGEALRVARSRIVVHVNLPIPPLSGGRDEPDCCGRVWFLSEAVARGLHRRLAGPTTSGTADGNPSHGWCCEES